MLIMHDQQVFIEFYNAVS